jgi:hypothetical protein
MERTNKALNPRHPIVVEIIKDVAQPDGGKLNLGNYGKWNFSMGGPGSRERLIHGEIGAIISTPGCLDQKIHADIPHLFNTVDTPPHLLHAFMPASVYNVKGKRGEIQRNKGRFQIGQTAFVCGSHKLEACARMMSDDGSGVEETFDRMIRPHVDAGDVILFDCRVLHFGLANNSGPLGEITSFISFKTA